MKKKKVSKPKDVTMNDLAVMIGKGFNAVDVRFDKVEKRLDNVEDRLDKIEVKIDEMDYRLARIENQHTKRLDIVEDKLLVIYTAFEKQLKIKLPK